MSLPPTVTCESLYASRAGVRIYELMVPEPDEDWELRTLLDLLGQRKGPVTVLGSGTGRFVLPLARAGIELVAVDRSPEMVKHLRNRLQVEAPHSRCVVVEADIIDYVNRASTELLILPATNIATFDSVERRALLTIVLTNRLNLWLSVPSQVLPDSVQIADGIGLQAIRLGDDRVLSLIIDDRDAPTTRLYQSIRHDVTIEDVLEDLDDVQEHLGTVPPLVASRAAGLAMWLTIGTNRESP